MEKTYNETLNIKDVGKTVTLCGWVAKKRDLGGLIFIDLRDRTGIIQLAFNPENKNYELANSLKNEYVIKVIGKVVERTNKNTNIKTGDIEINVDYLEILNNCEELPFTIEDNTTALEDTRLKYRYLDIRRNKLKENLLLRAEILHFLRNKMYNFNS